MASVYDSFYVVWETTSSYYLIPLLVTIIAVSLTILHEFNTKEVKLNEEVAETSPEIENLLKHQPQLLAKKIEEQLTDEQRENERKIQAEQISAIYDLLQRNATRFGETSMDDFEEQLRLYR